MLQILRLIRGLLTFGAGLVGLGMAVWLYLEDSSPAWEIRVLTSASLGIVVSVVILFLAIKLHELEQWLRRPRVRARHRAGVVDFGPNELPSLR